MDSRFFTKSQQVGEKSKILYTFRRENKNFLIVVVVESMLDGF